jgi:hypothetical protein
MDGQPPFLLIYRLVAGNHPVSTNDSLPFTKHSEMKKLFTILSLLISLCLFAQDKKEKKAVEIFRSVKTINANTTELTGKGKMDFQITHNFDDIAGSRGGIRNFFGLDNTTDVRIGFQVGVGKNLDLQLARVKAAGNISRIVELGLKYRFLQQTEDNSIPVSLAVFINNCISTMKASDSPIDDNYFQNLGDRSSQVIQVIVAKKIGKVSLQLNPTFLNQGFVAPNDDKSMFALGAAIRFPVSHKVNIIIDYFHPFRSESSEDFLFTTKGLKFYDPLGVGVEILTGGHVFHLNFTNAREILENRFLPRTISNWGKGEFRWGFNLSRKFTLWREKKGK